MPQLSSATAVIDQMIVVLKAGNSDGRISPIIKKFSKNSEIPKPRYPFCAIQCVAEDFESNEQLTTGTFTLELIVHEGRPEVIQEALRATLKQCVRELHRAKGFNLPFVVENAIYGRGVDTQSGKNLTVYGASLTIEVKYKEDYLT